MQIREQNSSCPLAVGDLYTTVTDQSLEVAAPGLLENDVAANGGELSVVPATEPGHGELELNANGSFSYTPVAGFTGTDVFTYRVSDGTNESAPATVAIMVADAPPAQARPTAIAGSASAVAYGRAGTVKVTVSPASATGQVELLAGARVVAKGTVSSGRARVHVPARALRPGRHALTLRYVGNADFDASTAPLRLRVAKAPSVMKVKTQKQVKRGKQAKLRIRVRAGARVPVTGPIRIKVAGRKAIVTRGKASVITVRLPKARKVGRMKVKVVYRGSDLTRRVTRKAVVQVRR